MIVVIPAFIAAIVNFLLACIFGILSLIDFIKISYEFIMKIKHSENVPLIGNSKEAFKINHFYDFLKRILIFIFFSWRGALDLEFSFGNVEVATSDLPAFVFFVIVVVGGFSILKNFQQENGDKDTIFHASMQKTIYIYTFSSVVLGLVSTFALLGAIIILNVGFMKDHIVFYYILFASQLFGTIVLIFFAAYKSRITSLLLVSICLTIRFAIYMVQTFVYNCDVNFICELTYPNDSASIALDYSSIAYYFAGECMVCILLYLIPKIKFHAPSTQQSLQGLP
jgi:sensor histidine kinase YesM